MDLKKAALVLAAGVLLISSFFLFFDSGGKDTPVILVSVDTLRYDRLTAAGYERNITPNLDEFVNDSYYFPEAYANAPWTLPSHSTVFTGKYPSQNGALTWKYKICEEEETLPETINKSGYETVSFNGDAAISSAWGYDQGFEIYDQRNLYLHNGTVKKSEKWLEKRENDHFFMFLHGYDVHSPYLVPDSEPLLYGANYSGDMIETRDELRDTLETTNYSNIDRLYWERTNLSSERDVEHLKDMYDNSVYYMDRSLGSFFQKLKEEDVYDDALIIVFSDHGEEFLEHGGIKHSEFYSETIRAPLAVKFPGQNEGKSIDRRVELRDIYPTILEFTGNSYEGSAIPLQDIISGERKHSRIYAERMAARMVLKDRYKLIWGYRGNNSKYELYDVREDPGEKENLAEEMPGKVEELNSTFSEYKRNYSSYCRADTLEASMFEKENFLE